MAKKPQTKKGGAAKPKPGKPKREKQTVEQLTDQERQKLLFSHKRKIKPLLEAEKLAKGAVTKAYELAKKEGIPKSELKLAIAYETEDGEEKQGKEIERILRIARWMNVPLGSQFEMFSNGKKVKPSEKYFEDGRIAALDDQPRKPPSHIVDNMTVHWFEGYDVGRKAMNIERVATGFMTLGEVATSVVPTNGNGAEEEDEDDLALVGGHGAAAVDSLTH